MVIRVVGSIWLFLVGVSLVYGEEQDPHRIKRQVFNFSSNTPPPGSQKCASNPSLCILPNYCRNGGSCTYDNDVCQTKCICTEEYTGPRCKEKKSVTSPDNSGCTRVCPPFNVCQNQGTCKVDKEECEIYCQCPDGFGGDQCQDVVARSVSEEPSLTTEASVTQESCTQNICESSSFNLCANNGTCKMNITSCKPYCICPKTHEGDNCQTGVDDPAADPVTPKVGALLHSLSERSCAPGFVCRYGKCNQELLAKGKFQCICDDGYINGLCTDECSMDCGDYGKCYLNGTAEACACLTGWQGERCDVLKPNDSNSWVWWVVGSCIAVFLLSIFVLIILSLWMWKRREVFIMKIVHYFMPYEDDDGKLFDAFISFKSHPDDESFVLKQIYQKLEVELGFKLCLHFRDFTAGETIINNIIWAVENSRRTVLIISPNYLGSEFARFEFQIAHLETLRLRQRIIPIMFQDVSSHSDKIDRTLKTIIDTITYLEWPQESNSKREDKFWKRLVLSLPKRKNVDTSKLDSMSSKNSKSVNKNDKSAISDKVCDLLSYKELNGKSTDTLWTEISLDDENTSSKSGTQNEVVSNGQVFVNIEEKGNTQMTAI